MKQKTIALVIPIILLIFATSFLTGCNGKESSSPSEKTYVFKYAHAQSESHPKTKSMYFFKEELEKISDGRIKVEIYTDGKLGTEPDVLDMVKTGQIEGCRGGPFERVNKAYLMYTLPFMWDNTDQVIAAMKSDVAHKINEDSIENGYYVPACGINGGFRNVTTSIKPIIKPSDLKGLKMRTPPIDMTLKTFKIIGANPQQVPYTETYMALKTGVVDAQENPFSNTVDMKFYEAQKYLSVIKWQIHPDAFFVNPDWFDTLPNDLKEMFNKVAIETMEYSTKIWLESENKFYEQLKEDLIVNELTPEATQEFVEIVKPVWQSYIDDGFFTWDEVNALIDAGKGN